MLTHKIKDFYYTSGPFQVEWHHAFFLSMLHTTYFSTCRKTNYYLWESNMSLVPTSQKAIQINLGLASQLIDQSDNVNWLLVIWPQLKVVKYLLKPRMLLCRWWPTFFIIVSSVRKGRSECSWSLSPAEIRTRPYTHTLLLHLGAGTLSLSFVSSSRGPPALPHIKPTGTEGATWYQAALESLSYWPSGITAGISKLQTAKCSKSWLAAYLV